MLDIKDLETILYQKYVVERKAIHTVAEEIGIATGSVYNYLKRFGIKTRDKNDYETTEKQRAAGRKAGASRRGKKCTEEQIKRMSEAQKGRYRHKTKYGGFAKQRADGYIAIYAPKHPACTADGMVMEHRLVMEENIGRYLTENEVVHHKNHKRNDNRIENLQLMTISEHARFHMLERQKKEGMTY